MKVLDLFSGIGGFSLGLERAGMHTVAFCESDGYANRVLAKHWPGVPRHDDIRMLDGRRYRGAVDLVCGGFPCQPVSVAGRSNGDADERWLWPEYARIIGEVRPRWVLAENVPGLLSNDSGRLFGGILRDLAELGYDVEWRCISAADVGAPHLRKRIWIVANTIGEHLWEQSRWFGWQGGEDSAKSAHDGEQEFVADAAGEGLERRCKPETTRSTFAQSPGKNCGELPIHWWQSEPDVGRVANGVPHRMDRLRCLGNAVVPQVVELIGRGIQYVGSVE